MPIKKLNEIIFWSDKGEKMKHEKWSCPKCSHREYDLSEMRVAGSFWTKIFNIQNKKYSAVTCIRCSYTEFFKDQSASKLANVFDFFTN